MGSRAALQALPINRIFTRPYIHSSTSVNQEQLLAQLFFFFGINQSLFLQNKLGARNAHQSWVGKSARPGAGERSQEAGRRRMRNQSKQKGFVSNLVPLVLKIHSLAMTFAAQRVGREVHKAHPQAAAAP